MPKETIDPVARVDAQRLATFVAAVFRAIDATPEVADIVASHLVGADLAGHTSHGVIQTAVYVDSARKGLLRPTVHGRLTRNDGPFLVVDGGYGFGQLVAREMTDWAIERARTTGVCVAGLAHAHHIGRVGTYGEQCVEAGMIGLFFANVVSTPTVAPFGGIVGRLGTNPVCIALPATATNPHVMLDFATSAIAFNKCRVAAAKGVEVPEGKLIDAKGHPTRDPSVMFSDPIGALRPFGDHKGYGLSLVCELLAGALISGMPITEEAASVDGVINNALAIIFDPARIGVANRADLSDFVLDRMRATPPAPDADHVMVPGDPEAACRADRLLNGVPVDPTTLGKFHDLGSAFGLDAKRMLWG